MWTTRHGVMLDGELRSPLCLLLRLLRSYASSLDKNVAILKSELRNLEKHLKKILEHVAQIVHIMTVTTWLSFLLSKSFLSYDFWYNYILLFFWMAVFNFEEHYLISSQSSSDSSSVHFRVSTWPYRHVLVLLVCQIKLPSVIFFLLLDTQPK